MTLKLVRAVLAGTVTLAVTGTLLSQWPEDPDLDRQSHLFLQSREDVVANSNEQKKILEIQRLETLGTIDLSEGKIVFPFEYVNRHLLIPVQLQQGQTEQPFLLDSGTPFTLVDIQVAGDVRLQHQVPLAPDAFYSLVDELVLKGAVWKQLGVVLTPLSAPDQPLSCLASHGVIGNNAMRHGVWQINYQAQTITLARALDPLQHLEKALQIPFNGNVGMRPLVEVDVGGANPIAALLDTGWGGNIHLAKADYTDAHLEDTTAIGTYESSTETLEGMATFLMDEVVLPHFSLGNLQLSHFPVLVNQDFDKQPYSLIGTVQRNEDTVTYQVQPATQKM